MAISRRRMHRLKPLATLGLSKFKGRRKQGRRDPRITRDVSGSAARVASRYKGGR